MEQHPALNNKWRIDYLIRTRQIPLMRMGYLSIMKRILYTETTSMN